MARPRKYDVTPGRIYTGKHEHRRVVHTFDHPERGFRIVYSSGGETNRECCYYTFRRWATAQRARRVKVDRIPRFALAAAR